MNENGWIVWLQPRPSYEVVAWRPDVWPPPARILVSIDDLTIPTLSHYELEIVRRDAAQTLEPVNADAIRKLLGMPAQPEPARSTRVEPRRAFYRSQRWGMTLWREGRITWIDVPA